MLVKVKVHNGAAYCTGFHLILCLHPLQNAAGIGVMQMRASILIWQEQSALLVMTCLHFPST